MGGDPETQDPAWTLVLDEHFANTDGWIKWNNDPFQDTIRMASCVNLIEGGGLRITGKDELIDGYYQGGLAQSIATYQFGYFECRCKIPPGILWPAFFLYGTDDAAPKPEIDVFEYLGANVLYMSTHLNGVGTTYQRTVGDLSTSYHTFAIKWSAESITYYLDDVVKVFTATGVPQTPLNLMVDLYIGGWAGSPTGVTFPVDFDVDYVKVWQLI